MTGKLVAMVTCENRRQAERIARALVEERLAACVNVLETSVRSVYRWEGRVERARETLLIVKTARNTFSRLERRVRQIHSYDVPEIIALPVVAGSRPYLAWMGESLAGERRRGRSQ